MMNPLEFEVALPPSAVLSAASATLGSSPVVQLIFALGLSSCVTVKLSLFKKVIVSRHEALEIWMQRSLGSVSSKESSLVSVWTRQDLLGISFLDMFLSTPLPSYIILSCIALIFRAWRPRFLHAYVF